MPVRLRPLSPTTLVVQREELLHSLHVVAEAAADVHALKDLVVPVMGGAEVLRHAVGSVESRDLHAN